MKTLLVTIVMLLGMRMSLAQVKAALAPISCGDALRSLKQFNLPFVCLQEGEWLRIAVKNIGADDGVFLDLQAGHRNVLRADPVPKVCAFGFKPILLPGYGKRQPPTPKELMHGELSPNYAMTAEATYHWSCPYEHAIELFGEARVSTKGKTILVDDQVVFEEQP